jgi:beta-phosphoglucomutase
MPFGAIWDLDGTLVTTERYHFESWRALLREHGRNLDYETFRPTFGLRNDDVLTSFLGFDSSYPIADLADRKETIFRDLLEQDGLQLQPGARKLVEHLHSLGFKQAIASSAPRGNIDIIVRLMPMGEHFQAVVSSEQIRHGKPAPDIILRAAEDLELDPSRCVVFEDAPAGVQAGRSAGCKVIALVAAFEAQALHQADLIVDSFDEVLWSSEQWERFLLQSD